ncbi:MAG TPA: SlyX family protein [Pseudomonadales bacterium]
MSDEWQVEMETRLAFQEQMLNELNDALVQQQKQSDELATLCRYLLTRLRELEGSDSGGDAAVIDEKPPHY